MIYKQKIQKIKKLLPVVLVKAIRQVIHKESHINRALHALKGQSYLEIGVRDGTCFKCINAPRKIAIDPSREKFPHKLLPSECFFEMTSDDFFANQAEQVLLHHKINVALVDGYHEFHYLLRDILNLEKFMTPTGVVFVHDFNPPTRDHACLRDNAPKGYWNGDGWKAAYYIRNFRPDLSFFTLNCDWGVGVITGFQAHNYHEPPSREVLEMCKSLDYTVLEKNRRQILQLRTPLYSYIFFNFIIKKKKLM